MSWRTDPLLRKEYYKKYYQKNKEYLKQRTRERYQNKTEEEKEIVKQYNKQYNLDNKEKICQRRKEYRHLNKHKINERRNERYHSDLQYKLSMNLRRRIQKAIKNNQKSGSAVDDLGCTIPELIQYIEQQFTEGMTWDNWSHDGWHLDHVKPLSSFDLTDRKQFLRASHYTNLQPLWSSDNMKKRDKLNWSEI